MTEDKKEKKPTSIVIYQHGEAISITADPYCYTLKVNNKTEFYTYLPTAFQRLSKHLLSGKFGKWGEEDGNQIVKLIELIEKHDKDVKNMIEAFVELYPALDRSLREVMRVAPDDETDA